MTKPELRAVVRGLTLQLAEVFKPILDRLAALEVKEKGLDGAVGPVGPPGPKGEPGRDGRDGVPGLKGVDGVDGQSGRDGLGFEDIAVVQDEFDPRRVVVRFLRGDQIREFALRIPCQIYQQVWVEGKTYAKGDTVTLAGSLWHCNVDGNDKKPGALGDDKTGWSLAVKRGRDGGEGKTGAAGPKGEKGEKGDAGRNFH